MEQVTSRISEKDHDKIVSQIVSASDNNRWISDHMSELREKHLHKFIAVRNGTIVAVAEDQEELFEILKDRESKNISFISIEFIKDKDELWIL